MLPVSSLVLVGAIGLAHVLPIPQERRTAIAAQQRAREEKLAALREKARQRLADDARWYGPEELQDIEDRYRAAHQPFTGFLLPASLPQLVELVEKYPRSTRSGCAALKLARSSAAEERERNLETVIQLHSDAWCDDGVQVGSLARALLAMHFVGLERYEEAERLASQVAVQFPGSVDTAGAPLDDLLPALRLLRPSK
jgi:hypothetical protein